MKFMCPSVLLCFFCTFNVYADSVEGKIIKEMESMNFSLALKLIKQNDFDINKQLANNRRIADYVLSTNYSPAIEMFLSNGMDPNPTRDNFYLNQSCLLGHNDTMKLLLDFGAPTEIWTDSYKTKKFGSPCIYFLLSASNEEASKFYIEKAMQQHGPSFINEKVMHYITMHKRSTDNIYQYIHSFKKEEERNRQSTQ